MYHLSLPVLVMLGVLALSLLAVYIVAPAGHRLGYSFSEAGRRSHRRGKHLKRLREAGTRILEETFPDTSNRMNWSDFEAAGAVQRLRTEEQLQSAAEDPDAFLCESTVRSRALLLHACIARTAADQEATAYQRRQALAQADLAPFLTRDFANQAANFASMLDDVIAKARADANEHSVLEVASECESGPGQKPSVQSADIGDTIKTQPADRRPAPQILSGRDPLPALLPAFNATTRPLHGPRPDGEQPLPPRISEGKVDLMVDEARPTQARPTELKRPRS